MIAAWSALLPIQLCFGLHTLCEAHMCTWMNDSGKLLRLAYLHQRMLHCGQTIIQTPVLSSASCTMCCSQPSLLDNWGCTAAVLLLVEFCALAPCFVDTICAIENLKTNILQASAISEYQWSNCNPLTIGRHLILPLIGAL